MWQYEQEKHITHGSGSNKDENIHITLMDNKEYEIPTNEIKGSFVVNMHNGACISKDDVAIPT